MQFSEEDQVSVRPPLVRIQAAIDQLVCPSSLRLSGAVLRSQIKLRTGILVDIEIIRSRLRRQHNGTRLRVEPRRPLERSRQGMQEDHPGRNL
jgi:hypothetical protein